MNRKQRRQFKKLGDKARTREAYGLAPDELRKQRHDDIGWLSSAPNPDASMVVLNAPSLDPSNTEEVKEWWAEHAKPFSDAGIRVTLVAGEPSGPVDERALKDIMQ